VCRVVSCPIVSCIVMSFRVVSCHVVSCHVVSWRVISCHVVSSRVVSCRIHYQSFYACIHVLYHSAGMSSASTFLCAGCNAKLSKKSLNKCIDCDNSVHDLMGCNDVFPSNHKYGHLKCRCRPCHEVCICIHMFKGVVWGMYWCVCGLFLLPLLSLLSLLYPN
jgi:hypothetical protein